jgi:hypothetical protein
MKAFRTAVNPRQARDLAKKKRQIIAGSQYIVAQFLTHILANVQKHVTLLFTVDEKKHGHMKTQNESAKL